MSKKKFSQTNVGKFLLEKIPNIVSSIAGDTPVGSVVKALIGGSDMSDQDKEIALKKLDQEIHEFDGITKRWVADSNSQSFLARNIRPMVLLALTSAYIIGWFMGLDTSDTSDLVTWVLCGYFGARTVDKTGFKLKK
tara:strand:+ start:113 stop:523 length:411 start_codon:yes stop_codon:yes gene_type:complete